ncbi:hypothetical protein DYB25_005639 [Aphanomyces astaci]|uniref:CBF1-interacting co-repressor CIR N-terminal domain-containing protein n=1 Tax=Aphanomyces astaci TaxID=112090 RepID=A0A397BPF4_APHAT|nr:hypothetical protein DYB25_005639 [Aphanomyces astaci]RHY23560.1 hypothetical protein DYB36_004083 [Aphanomyces astaci]RHY95116.1 hypothetical protein DYB26_001646 [Aphanomyces astaci]
MSLAFLAKKSWHTSNLSNVEKVWKAEQKAALEDKKLAEWKKNVEEERQLKELRELQAKASGTKANTTERVDWMYEGPMAASQREKTAEEYLLGKEYEEKPEESDLKKLASHPGSLYMASGAGTASDSFSRLNEDPMMFIKYVAIHLVLRVPHMNRRKQQKATQLSIMKNPVKMKRIKDRVEQELKERKAEKRAKKEAKKAKKASKKDKKLRDKTDDDESLRRRSHRRSSSPEDERSPRRRRDDHERSRHPRRDDDNVPRRGRSSSPSSRRRHREPSRSRDRSRSPRRSSRPPPHDASSPRQDRPAPLKGYGLLGGENARKCHDIDTSSLGPSRKFLNLAMEKREREEEEKAERFKRARAATDEATKEDKEARLQAMLEDAQRRERALDARLRKSDKHQPNEGDGEASATQQNPSFLKDLHEAAYVHSKDSMEERLARNKHYIQRNADSKNFMQR